mgnify:CR=1 FL=1
MTDVTSKVLRFLFVFIFSKVNLKEYFRVHKHFFILLIANVIISLLYCYMTEQAIRRTEQYRNLKTELKVANEKLVNSQQLNEDLTLRLHDAEQSLLTSDVTVTADSINNEYNKWSSELESIQSDIDTITP